MGTKSESRVSQLWNALVNSGNVVYHSGLVATPASGAPGAYAKLLANATPTTPWWVVGVDFGNLTAGATAFTYQVARDEAGGGTTIANTINVLVEAGTAVLVKFKELRFPVRVATGVGAAGRQTTASGQTLDMDLFYAQAVGS